MSELGIRENTLYNSTEDRSIRPMEVFRCSLVLGVGYLEALKWLSDVV
jgi:hypothetical protein